MPQSPCHVKASHKTNITFALHQHIMGRRLPYAKNLRPYIKIKLGNLLASHTSNLHVICSKWVLKSKLKPDGSLDHLKSRLVAKGYHQVNGVDYIETFSLVIKPDTIWLILFTTLVKKCFIQQLDVKKCIFAWYAF